MSRARQSVAQNASQRASQANNLPAYAPLTSPLTTDCQRQLANLSHAHNLAKLKDRLSKADKLVSELAGDVNDRLYYHAALQQRRDARRAAAASEDSGMLSEEQEQEQAAEEAKLAELREKVEKMTKRMEESVRKCIDAQGSVESVEEAMRTTQRAIASSTNNAMLPPTQSQRTLRGTAREDGDVPMSGMTSSINPTAPESSTTQNIRAPSEVFTKKLQDDKDLYTGLTLKTRYAQHNSYVAFKSMVHDALHPEEDAPPLPHRDTWFTDGGSPAPGMALGGQRDGEDGDSSDDDIAIARERISTKCPLTLREFEDPVTSTKCPHAFERAAILEMIRAQRGGVAQCPVPGCQQHLSAKDLRADPAFVRKVKRLQRNKQARDDSDEEDQEMGEAGRATQVELEDSGDEI